MSTLCYFLCYLNAALFLTSCVLGGYVITHLFIADRLFWKILFSLSLIAGCIRYSNLYKTLLTMIFDHEQSICFYRNTSFNGFFDTFIILFLIALFIFFLASGKCTSWRNRRRS
jgi:hypothetical protein